VKLNECNRENCKIEQPVKTCGINKTAERETQNVENCSENERGCRKITRCRNADPTNQTCSEAGVGSGAVKPQVQNVVGKLRNNEE